MISGAIRTIGTWVVIGIVILFVINNPAMIGGWIHGLVDLVKEGAAAAQTVGHSAGGR